jgi:hypothetical protein
MTSWTLATVLAGAAACAQAGDTPGAAAAQAPAAAVVQPATVDPRALGIAESVLNYCTRVQAEGTSTLLRKHEAMIRGLSKAELVGIRQSAEYRAAFTAENGFVANVDEHNVGRICPGPISKRDPAGKQP